MVVVEVVLKMPQQIEMEIQALAAAVLVGIVMHILGE
jgi:hypothetical protein